MIRLNKPILLIVIVVLVFSCSEKNQTERLFNYFLEKHVERIKPINKSLNIATWASYTGSASFNELLKESNRTDSIYLTGSNTSEYYQNLLNSLYSNPSEFEVLEKINKSSLISDPLLKRQFHKVFLNYISIKNNWDETEKMRTELLDKFYDLKRRENSYFDSLSSEPESSRSSKWINEFSILTEDFRGMIKALNRDVKALGYENYFDYLMDNQEITISSIDHMVDTVEQLTHDDYLRLLNICRSGKCSKECNPKGEMTPFQFRCAHSKMLYPREWCGISYSQEDFIKLIGDLFSSGGFSIEDIYKRSNIWYDKKKINNSFFFCVDFDEDDYRIYANIEPNALFLNSLVHEFSHALHYKYVDKDVPYFLKTPHSIIAEAVGIYFDNKLFTSENVQAQLGLPCLRKNIFFQDFSNPSELMFLRKLLRNIEFEWSIYEDPDQDFNALWWELNKKFLFIDPTPSERLPEWMTSFHLVDSEGININYLFAVVIAAQLEHYFPENHFGPIKDKIMKFGDSVPWYELVELSTGEPLNLNYLRDFYLREDQQELIASIKKSDADKQF